MHKFTRQKMFLSIALFIASVFLLILKSLLLVKELTIDHEFKPVIWGVFIGLACIFPLLRRFTFCSEHYSLQDIFLLTLFALAPYIDHFTLPVILLVAFYIWDSDSYCTVHTTNEHRFIKCSIAKVFFYLVIILDISLYTSTLILENTIVLYYYPILHLCIAIGIHMSINIAQYLHYTGKWIAIDQVLNIAIIESLIYLNTNLACLLTGIVINSCWYLIIFLNHKMASYSYDISVDARLQIINIYGNLFMIAGFLLFVCQSAPTITIPFVLIQVLKSITFFSTNCCTYKSNAVILPVEDEENPLPVLERKQTNISIYFTIIYTIILLDLIVQLG